MTSLVLPSEWQVTNDPTSPVARANLWIIIIQVGWNRETDAYTTHDDGERGAARSILNRNVNWELADRSVCRLCVRGYTRAVCVAVSAPSRSFKFSPELVFFSFFVFCNMELYLGYGCHQWQFVFLFLPSSSFYSLAPGLMKMSLGPLAFHTPWE